jgi:hypothetical protein
MPDLLSHSWIEVELEGRWWPIDSYINDHPFFLGGKAELRKRGWATGFSSSCAAGEASHEYDPKAGRFVQMGAVANDYGCYDDPGEFYATPLYTNRPGLLKRIAYRLALKGNQRPGREAAPRAGPVLTARASGRRPALPHSCDSGRTHYGRCSDRHRFLVFGGRATCSDPARNELSNRAIFAYDAKPGSYLLPSMCTRKEAGKVGSLTFLSRKADVLRPLDTSCRSCFFQPSPERRSRVGREAPGPCGERGHRLLSHQPSPMEEFGGKAGAANEAAKAVLVD